MTRADKSGGRILFGGDLGRYARPILPDPSPGVEADVLLRRIDLRRSPASRRGRRRDAGADHQGDVRAPRQGDHSGVCDRPRRRAAVLAVQARGRRARLPKLPIYVDSPMAIKGIAYYMRARDELDKEIVEHAPQAAALHARSTRRSESKALVERRRAGRDHRVERHGDRRPRPASPVCRPAGPAEHRAVRRLPGRRHARPAAGRRCTAREDVRPAGARSTRESRRSTACRRTPTPAKSCGGCARFPRAPKTTYLVHGETVAQDALKARITKELGWNVEIPAHGQKVDLPL